MISHETAFPERYEGAPLNHPAVSQSAFVCKLDGNLVIDLPAHDADHARQDRLEAKYFEEEAAHHAAVVDEITNQVVRATEPVVDTTPIEPKTPPAQRRTSKP